MKKGIVAAGTALFGIGVLAATLFLTGIIEDLAGIAPTASEFRAKPGGGLFVDYTIGKDGTVTVIELETDKPVTMVPEKKDGKRTGKLVLAEDTVVLNQKIKRYKRAPASIGRAARRRVSR